MLLWRYIFVKCNDFQISNSQRFLSISHFASKRSAAWHSSSPPFLTHTTQTLWEREREREKERERERERKREREMSATVPLCHCTFSVSKFPWRTFCRGHCTLGPRHVKLWTTHSRRLWKVEDPLLWIFQSFHWYRMLSLNLAGKTLSSWVLRQASFVFCALVQRQKSSDWLGDPSPSQ